MRVKNPYTEKEMDYFVACLRDKIVSQGLSQQQLVEQIQQHLPDSKAGTRSLYAVVGMFIRRDTKKPRPQLLTAITKCFNSTIDGFITQGEKIYNEQSGIPTKTGRRITIDETENGCVITVKGDPAVFDKLLANVVRSSAADKTKKSE